MKFKAKIPFAAFNQVFNPSDDFLHDIDNDELVQAWADADYCEIVGPSEPKKEEKQEIVSDEPTEPVNDEAIEKVEEVEEQPKIEEKTANASAFDSMTYPQLKKAAKEAKIKNYQSMKQVDLIKALKGE